MSKNSKVALAVVLLVVAGYLVYRSMRSDSGLPGRFMFVDVSTGDLFDMKMEDVVMIPAKNPKTGERTLLPCVERDKGIFIISRQFASSLHGSLKDVNNCVDVNTLEVRRNGGG